MTIHIPSPRRPGGRGSDRGRPRDPAVDVEIIAATITVLQDVGYAGLTIAEVARRAGVSKPTVYRRWAEKAQLVVEAIATKVPPSSEVDTGSTTADLFACIAHLTTTLTRTPFGRVLPGLVAEMAADPELAHGYRQAVIEPVRDRWRAVVNRGISRGDLTPDTDVELVLDLLAGPLYLRLLITGQPVDPGYAAAAIDVVLTRFGATPMPAARSANDVASDLTLDREPF